MRKPAQKLIRERELVFMEGHGGPHRGSKRRNESGQGRLKAILYTVVFVLVIYSSVKIVPAYVSDFQLKNKMEEQARFAVVNHYTDEQIRDVIYKEMKDLDIPAKREDIKVVADMSQVRISLNYTVPVDILFYHVDLHFTPSSETKSLI